jgi:Tol biopolymer transport system component
VAGGEPVIVAGMGLGADIPSIRGNRLVYVQIQGEEVDVWRVAGPKSEGERTPERITKNNPFVTDTHVSISPDGMKIAYQSDRTGVGTIWVADSDGSNPRQLTRLQCNWPSWSPDGRAIAFNSSAEGSPDIYVVEADGGQPRRLTQDPSTDEQASWSRDGEWIYFVSGRTGAPQIWKVPVEGGDPVQITTNGGSRPLESPDGKHVYFCKLQGRGLLRGTIWRVPTQGGEEEQIVMGPVMIGAWDILADRLYYAELERDLSWGERVYYLDLISKERTQLFQMDFSFMPGSLSVAPDEKWIYYAVGKYDNPHDIMLVENFH